MTYTSVSPITINGLTLNTTDTNGTQWRVRKFDGWAGATNPTGEMVRRTRRSGFWAGDSFSEGRHMALTIMVISASAAQHSLDLDTLNAAFPRTFSRMDVSESGRVRYAYVRRSGEILPQKINRWTSIVSVMVSSKDWRKFGDDLVGLTFLPASSGGLTVPFTVPFTIDAVSVSGQIALTNPGNEVGPVRMRIDGPCTGPVVTHVGSASALIFSSSLVLLADEWLDIDMEAHTVLANGQASRAGYITSRGWSGFDPGVNVWSFTAAAFDPASQLTVTATPADE